VNHYFFYFNFIDISFISQREYPVSGGLPGNIRRPEDKQNYLLLLQEIRQQLDVAGPPNNKTYLLTVA
jgi:chitinase